MFLFHHASFPHKFYLGNKLHCFCCAYLNCIDRYVDLLLGEFKHFKTRLAHGGIRKEVLLSFIIMKQYSSSEYVTIYSKKYKFMFENQAFKLLRRMPQKNCLEEKHRKVILSV